MSEDKKSETKWKKIHVVLTLLSIAVLPIGFSFWLFTLETQPVITIASQKAPVPNAFDTLSTIGNLLADDAKIEFAIVDRHFTKKKDDRVYTIGEMQSLLKENEPALRLFSESQKQAYMTPPLRSITTQLPYLKEYRKLARLLILDSKIRELKGKYYEAALLRMDLLRFGDRVKVGGTILHSLVGSHIEQIGSEGILGLCGKLTAKESNAILKEMLEIKRRRVSLKDILIEEKRCGQAKILESFQKYISFASVYAITLLDKDRKSSHNSMNYMFSGRRGVVQKYSTYMDESIAYAELPYSSHPAPPIMPDDTLNKIFVENTLKFRFKMLSGRVADDMIILALALKIYKDEHGKYPEKLSELAPGVLARLPEDPFALKGSFRYRIEGNGYVLYSVGPDGKDDGGKPIENNAKGHALDAKSRKPYRLEEESLGDILLGKNVR